MSMGSFFHFRKSKDTLAVVFDVGSASVGGALVLLAEEKKPRIVYAVRREIEVQKKFDLKRFIASMQEVLRAVVDDIGKNGLPHLSFTRHGHAAPQAVYCILGAPWFASHIREISYVEETPFRASKELFSELSRNEADSFVESQEKRYGKEGVPKGATAVIEREILRVRMNGYRVEAPYGREARNLDLLLYLSVAPAPVLEAVKTEVAQSYALDNAVFHSSTLSLFTALRDVWTSEESFLFCDITGEITEFSFVEDGALREAVSMPIGRNIAIRAVSDGFGVSTEEAYSLIKLSVSGKADKKTADKLARVMGAVEDEWLENFEKATEGLGGRIFIPPLIFFAVDYPFVPWFSGLFKKRQSAGDATHHPAQGKADEGTAVLGGGRNVVASPVTHDIFSPYVNAAERTQRDPFLFAGALFAQKMHFLER